MMRVWDNEFLAQTIGDSYVTKGLVLWYDGINNTRHGHDASSNRWEDLSGNGFDAAVFSYSGRLKANGYYFNGTPNYAIVLSNFGNQKVTYEVVFSLNRSSHVYNETILTHNPVVSEQGQAAFICRNPSGNLITGSNVPSMILNAATSSQFVKKPSTLSVVYSDPQKVYANAVNQSGGTATLSTFKRNTELILGVRMASEDASSYSLTQSLMGMIYSVRVYDRALSAQEIAQNYAVDKMRFGSGVIL